MATTRKFKIRNYFKDIGDNKGELGKFELMQCNGD